MIREIINFVDNLEVENPEIFNLNITPSEGLHLWVDIDSDGNWVNNKPKEDLDYIVYKKKDDVTALAYKAAKYESYARRAGGNTMNKVLCGKKQIFSCSPYSLSFKYKSYTNPIIEGDDYHKIINLSKLYFAKAVDICLDKEQKNLTQKVKCFEYILPSVLECINNLTLSDESETEDVKLLTNFKENDYICIYMRDISVEDYKLAHNKYLNSKLFNTNIYNSSKQIEDSTYGLSGYKNGDNSKKVFLKHKTASMFKGVSGRITAEDALALNKFDLLLSRRVLPNPLPIFIDKSEFKTNNQIIKVFNDEGDRTFSYPQILKSIYKNDDQIRLSNYYLLFFDRGVVKDFDFVSSFNYNLKYCKIKNIFSSANISNESIHLKTIFSFENYIVEIIFNNSLVKISKDKIMYNYFNDIDPKYVNGGYPISDLIYRYRKAFYDFIYKSQKQAISQNMFDAIMLTSILSDIKPGETKEKSYTIDNRIKEKLNIWFSLGEFFNNNEKNITMANKLKELLDKMDLVANDETIFFDDDVAEFAFGAGQIIYFLLSKSRASNASHALLEPFMQKTSAENLQNAIANSINTYKHDISFGKGRFERLSSQVLSFETRENLKNYQKYLLAGYFATSVIYKKTNKEEKELINA